METNVLGVEARFQNVSVCLKQHFQLTLNLELKPGYFLKALPFTFLPVFVFISRHVSEPLFEFFRVSSI